MEHNQCDDDNMDDIAIAIKKRSIVGQSIERDEKKRAKKKPLK